MKCPKVTCILTVFNGADFIQEAVESILQQTLTDFELVVRYKGLLVKDIFSNLFAKWTHEKFPDIKIFLLIRHPFSVALSKVKTQGKNWFWGFGPGDLFNQELLLDDFLGPFRGVYKTTENENDPFLNMVLLWAVINYVPLKQFSKGQLHVVFYENILMNPDKEISRLLRLVGKTDVEEKRFLPQALISKSSWVSGSESNHVKGIPLIGSWKNELTRKQIDTGMGILDQFGLSSLYNEECMPDIQNCDLCFPVFNPKTKSIFKSFQNEQD